MSIIDLAETPDIKAWAELVGELFSGTANNEKTSYLVSLLLKLCRFDHCVIFAYRGESVPICMFSSFNSKQHKAFVSDYQGGPYLLDPFYKASYDGIDTGLYGIRTLAPDHFFLSEYYLSYYRNVGLEDEIGFFVEPSPGVRVVMSLMREGSQSRFTLAELSKLSVINPIVNAFLKNLWQADFSAGYQAADNINDDMIHRRLELCFQNFGDEILTQREQQISQMLLRGHSSASISNELEISPGTVKIHRKNMYAKLKLSSQADLFTLFLSSLSSPAAHVPLEHINKD